MAIMGKPVWAVMCGAIRQDFELYTTLAILCGYRAEGLIDGIVVSTWTGEPDNIPGLREKLEKLSVDVVELEPLDEMLGKYTNLNFARQERQMRAGLDHLPDDVFVIKCRTDFSEQKIRNLEPVLRGAADLTVGSHGAWHTHLEYRVVVARLAVIRPFWLVDLGFLGHRNDLYKMLGGENTLLKYGCSIKPDMAWFSNLFSSEYPIIGELFRLTQGKNLFIEANVITRALQRYYAEDEHKIEDFELPGALNKFFALYFILMENCFYLLTQTRKKLAPFYLGDVFRGSKELGMFSDVLCQSAFTNMEILRMILEGECVPTKGYLKLYQEINRLKWPGYARRVHITRADYLEMRGWVENVLRLDPDEYLHWDGAEDAEPDRIGFSEALDVLFSEFALDSDEKRRAFHDVMYNVCFEKERAFYKAILENLDTFRSLDEDLYQCAVPAATRSELPASFKRCAKELYAGTVAPEREAYYGFIFRRWASIPSRVYRWPIPADSLCAFYYYGLYEERKGGSDVSRTFYGIVAKYAGVSDQPEPASYACAALERIKRIAASRYEECPADLNIRYMVDFLYDEFSEAGFTKEAAAYLAPYFAQRKYARPFLLGEADAFPRLLSAAERAKDQTEAECVLGLLLREKSAQEPETRERADRAIRTLTERFALPDTCLLRADRLGTGETFEADPAEIATDEQFVTLLRLLADKKYLASHRRSLLRICGGERFRMFALSFFERVEKTPEVAFFAMKRVPLGLELWVRHTGYMETGFDGELVPLYRDDWVQWPYTEVAAGSCLASFVRIEKDAVVAVTQFGASMCRAKERLLSEFSKAMGVSIDDKIRRITLKTTRICATAPEQLDGAVNAALDGICHVGGGNCRLRGKARGRAIRLGDRSRRRAARGTGGLA